MDAITKMYSQLVNQLLPNTGKVAGSAPIAIKWLRAWLAPFNPAKLAAVDFRVYEWDQDTACSGNANPPPKRSRKQGWTLWCGLAPNYPNTVPVALPPFYRGPDGVWAPAESRLAHFGDRIPDFPQDILESYLLCIETDKSAAAIWAAENVLDDGARITGYGHFKGKNRKHMIKVEGREPIATLNESVVFIFTFLAYSWLRHTRQIPGIGGGADTAAGLFACNALDDFRKETSGE